MSIDEYINKLDGNKINEIPTRWKCSCSKEKMINLLKLISEKEKQDIIKEHGKLEVTCNYCMKKYAYQ